MKKLGVVGFCLAMGLVMHVKPAIAGTTGKLAGAVQDSEGAFLAGAKVTATSPALIGEPQVIGTGKDGTFLFPALPPGVYSVRVELQGFKTQDYTEVRVRLDGVTEIAATMPLGEFGGDVEVTASIPIIDPTQVAAADSFTIDYLEDASVGSSNRNFQMILLHAAGVSGRSRDVVDPTDSNTSAGNPNVFGSTSGENAYFVDGIETTDPVTATFANNFNFDAIQEISFLKAGYEAEYGLATGGLVNLITKSGGNSFTGTFDTRFRSTSFVENGEFFDREDRTDRAFQASITLGGPIRKDRLWFFVSAEHVETEFKSRGSVVGREFEGQNYIGKLTWSINDKWNLVGKTFADPADIDESLNRFVTPDARLTQEQAASISQVNISGVIKGDAIFDLGLSLQRGDLDTVPTSSDFLTPGIEDTGTDVISGNRRFAELGDRSRDQLKTAFSLFVDDVGGFHEFKIGAEYSDRSFKREFIPTGLGFYYRDFLGDLDTLWLTTSTGPLENDGTVASAFIQDSWSITPNLTLKLGARWDQASYDDSFGEEIVDVDKVQPRLGLAWDITNDSKTIGRISWGRYMHPGALTLSDFVTPAPFWTTDVYLSCSTFFGNRDACELSGLTIIDDPTGRDTNGWFLVSPAGPFTPNRIAADLSPTFSEEWVVSIERELFQHSSVEVSYIKKDTNDIFEDTCNGNSPTPSEDAVCDFTIVANLSALDRDYEGFSLEFRSRFKKRLNLLASYTYSKSRGSVEYTQFRGTDFDTFPIDFVNRFGFLSDDRRHRFKINGYVYLPLGLTVSFDGFWSSEFAWTPLTGREFLEPRGSRRGNDNYQLDLQIAKNFGSNDVEFGLIASIFNVFDDERVVSVCPFDLGCRNPSGGDAIAFGDPFAWQTPRRYEVGLRVEF